MTDETENTATEIDTDSANAALWDEIVGNMKGEKPESAESKPQASAAPESSADDESADESEAGDAEDVEDTEEIEPEDIWAAASEDQRKAFKDLEHRYKSDQGRVTAMQKQLDQLKQQLTEARQAKPESPPKNDDNAVDWAAFERDYPDEAKAFKAMQKQSDEKIEQLTQALQGMQNQTSMQLPDLLDATRPGWRETIESKDFDIWLAGQEDDSKARYTSTKVADAVSLLNDYEKHKAAKKDKAAKLKADRDARAKNSESVNGRSTAPSVDSADEGDPEAMWQAAVSQVEKRIGVRRH